jgi:uncharacterized membrane protein YhaH (DUF805 family)
MRGEVINVEGPSGLISGDDGVRYPFAVAAARHVIRLGDRVDFTISDGAATDIFLLSSGLGAAADAPFPRGSAGPRADLSLWGYFKYSVTKKYADGSGRARRKEYWSFVLFFWLLFLGPTLAGGFLDALLGIDLFGIIGGLLGAVVLFGLFVPMVCVLIRRYHDVGLTGWLILIGLIPYVGGLISFVISVLDSQRHTNKHGPVPGYVARDTAEVFS